MYRRAVSVTSILVTLAGLALVPTAPVVAAQSGEVAVPAVKVDSRPDRVSAMATAAAQGSRVEDVSARTPTTTTYANPDGTWTTEAYAGVVRSKVDDGTWVPVDPSLEKVAGQYEPKAVPDRAGFSDGGDRSVGSVAAPNGSAIGVGWPTKLPTPQVNGAQLTYPNAAPNADLVVTSRPDGFNYSMVLAHAPAAGTAPVEFKIPLTFSGGTPVVQADGSVRLEDGKRQLAVMTAPVMWDNAKSDSGAPAPRRPVAATVEGSGASRTLVLKPDMSFLQDPSTVYPVTVDPTVVLAVGGDTWVDTLLNQSSQYSSTELQVGSNSLGITRSRSFMYFDFSPLYSMTPGVLTSATVQLSDFESGACPGTAVRMSRITSGWTLSGLTWSNQPTATTAGSSTSSAALGTNGCSPEGTVSFDATAIASSWFNDGTPQDGVEFAADNEGIASGWRRFRSMENGDLSKAPKMVLTYNSYPNTPTGLTVSPGSNGYASSTTPTLSAVVSDPDGGPTRGYFEVRSGSGVVWSGSSAMATSGARVSVTVPSGLLGDGSTYTVAAYSQDSSLNSQTAETVSMPVDTSPPTSSITASAFTAGTWTVTPPASSTFTFHGSSGTGGFYVKFDGVDLGPVAASSSGDFVSSPWVPTAGWHTTQITPVDLAGNLGSPTTFSFGVGGGGFTTPNEWTESTSSFPIDASGPPNATGANVQFRLLGETTWHTASQLTTAGSPWSGAVTTSAGRSETPVLVWNSTAEAYGGGTLSGPAGLQLRTCFHYASASDSCTDPREIDLITSAMGGNYPTATLGPATVGLSTGEATIDGFSVADSKVGLRSTFNTFDPATLSTGLFGPGWSDPGILSAPTSDTHAEVTDNRSKDGSFVITDPGVGFQTFVPAVGSGTSFVPAPATGDSTSLTFTPGSGGNPDKLELSHPIGAGAVKTTWTLKASDTGGASEWTVDSVDAPGTASDLMVSSNHQRPTFISESDPSQVPTCNATTQPVGCRGIGITYSGTGASTRVASVTRVIGAATQAAVSTTTIATYAYDGTGKLASVCSTAPAVGKPTLCTGYTYTTVNGRTLLAQVQPAGLAPWRISYDSIGRLTSVNRARPDGSGDATWSVDYNLALNASGLPDLGSTAAAQWGQTSVPTRVYAVYAPYAGTANVSKATLYYAAADGTTTNTAIYGPSGWLVSTNWYDAKGNVVQSLDGTGWARVQAAASTDRPRVANEASSYTVYNTWGDANTIGTRVVDQYGPAHTAALSNGTTGLFRTHTHTMYDDDPNVDPTLIANRPGSAGLGLVVEETTSASNSTMTSDNDGQTTTYGYDPVVSGDGNGWNLGLATKVTANATGTAPAVAFTRYDTSGNEIESRQPGGLADSSGAGSDARSTDITFYTAGGTGDCGGKPLWNGLVCKVSPAAQPGGVPIPTTYISNYDDDLNPTTIQELSGGVVTRTTTTTYDNVGRVTNLTKATAGSGVTNETITTTYGYDNSTGLPTTIVRPSDNATISTVYDNWGRIISYVDAFGATSTSAYDAAGNLASITSSGGTYTYTYGPGNLVSSFDAGGGVGAFTYAYNANGAVASVTYPNGVVADRSYDEVGTPIGLAYRQGSTQLMGFASSLGWSGRATGQSSPASSRQFTYDQLGHLTQVQDVRPTGCVTRTYGFDSAANRISSATYGPGSSGVCQTTTAIAARSYTFDSAGRITNAGYTYDTLGRTLTAPQVDAGPSAAGDLTATYHADDKVATLSQRVVTAAGSENDVMSYSLDPTQRFSSVVQVTNGSETNRLRYHYADTSDSASSVDSSNDGGQTWIVARNIVAPTVGFAASTSAGTTVDEVTNLHGDIVASMPNTSGTTAVNGFVEPDEFGNSSATTTSLSRYSYLGNQLRSADTPGHATILMGSRLYNPSTGAFLSGDSVPGGNATNYDYPADPINNSDPTGNYTAPAQDGGGSDPCAKAWAPLLAPSHWGFVSIPFQYCYNPNGPNPTVHDYCSFSKDNYFSVSFKGPCAYHDMCLEFRWGYHRSDCDHMLQGYLHRNCNAVYAHNWLDRLGCNRVAGAYYYVVALKTQISNYSHGPWSCLIVYGGGPGDGMFCVSRSQL